MFGIGFNTYGTAMLVYQTHERPKMYREAHNDYLQLAAEGGLLLTIPIAMAVALFAREVWRRFREGADSPMTWTPITRSSIVDAMNFTSPVVLWTAPARGTYLSGVVAATAG